MARSKKKPLPEAGAAFVFRLADGRYGVCRVLRQAHGNDVRWLGTPAVLVATSAWIGDAIPDSSDPALRPTLHNTRISPNGGEPILEWQDEPPPRAFKLIGTIPPTPDERKAKCDSSGCWENSPILLLAQWRWQHDREALLAEEAIEAQQEAEELDARNKRIERSQRSMTLAQLARRRFFAHWTVAPHKAAIRASRAVMKRTVQALQALGPSAAERQKKKVLRECVEEFNRLNDTLGQFIETSERDDICTEFDLLVHACGLGHYENLADKWRDW